MRARLILESGLASPPVCELDDSEVAHLGRNRDNSIVLQDRHASRWHAQVFASNGLWYLRDQVTTNGTRIDGVPVRSESPLHDGQVIAIGDTRLRFRLLNGTTPSRPSSTDEPLTLHGPERSAQTLFQADELTVLFGFMNDSLAESATNKLVSLALEAAALHLGADQVGFQGLDGDDPDFRMVLPAQSPVNRPLSQQMTQQMLRENRSVWLCSPTTDGPDSASLAGFRDALCVPLRASAALADPSFPPNALLGALHVYRSSRPFSEREVRFCEVLAGSLATTLHLRRAARALEADNSRLRVRAAVGEELIGASAGIVNLRDQICLLGDTNCSVLIMGESGVGKELVALGLHRESPRAAGPLITVNCAAITASMPESELFGHVKGAFTGATRDHQGFFLQADMGTLFLDEIGELSLDLQAKLLRAIETKTFRPVGGRADVKSNVRVLAATNRDLEREVREGRFRRDLYYRFVSRIHVPPLRDRPEDIPLLVNHFLDQFRHEYRRRVSLSEAALKRLQTYPWPGNVRQLRCVLEAAVAQTRNNSTINASDLHLDAPEEEPTDLPPSLNLQELEAWAIRQALERTGGNNTHAARILGIHRDTLIRKLKEWGPEGRS